jgi:hypothetical protein
MCLWHFIVFYAAHFQGVNKNQRIFLIQALTLDQNVCMKNQSLNHRLNAPNLREYAAGENTVWDSIQSLNLHAGACPQKACNIRIL